MEQHIQKIRTTLAEETGLIGQMLELSEQTRTALVRHDVASLNAISAKQQTLMMRLQLVRQTQEHLTAHIREELGEYAPAPETGIKGLLRHLRAGEEMLQLGVLETRLRDLAIRNATNEKLLEKQFQSLTAFQQLVDLVSGNQKVYDRSGAVDARQAGMRIEHQG
jgi:hypothetical protein